MNIILKQVVGEIQDNCKNFAYLDIHVRYVT